ncbi:MAG: SMC-Scp complex subunit ScpB [Chitinophagaceae bacterium]
MEIADLIPQIEALIFASDRPLTLVEITEMINNAHAFLEDRAEIGQIQVSVEAIYEKYQSPFYSFEVRESGGGYQFLTKREYHKTVAQLNGDKFIRKLSTASLETLSIIAYKQPISKGEIEYIRGVNSDYSIQKLLEKDLILISGRSEELPGKPLIYTTTRTFMDYFGINSPQDLPKIKEVLVKEISYSLPPQDKETNGLSDETDPAQLVVREDGELVVHQGNLDKEEPPFNPFPDAESRLGPNEDSLSGENPTQE